ncbi:MAG: hypothetical protein ACO38I_05555 [Ilumatobacteraceae bacterium]
MDGPLRRKHLLVLEDDCEFVGDAAGVLARSLRRLDARPSSWATLHLGHLPMGPTIPTAALGGPYVITWTAVPFTGHAYVVNRRFTHRIIQPSRRFRRPYSQEGFCQMPIFKKFAIQPVIATQNRRPKELVMIDSGWWPLGQITSSYDFSDFNHLFCVLGLVQTVILIVAAARLVGIIFRV